MTHLIKRAKCVDCERMRKNRSAADPVSQVRRGYPVGAFAALAKDLSLPEADVIAALGASGHVVALRRRDGRPLSLHVSDRVFRARRVIELSTNAIGDHAGAVRWLCREHPAFGGATALSLMDTTAGYELVQQELSRLTHGVCAQGACKFASPNGRRSHDNLRISKSLRTPRSTHVTHRSIHSFPRSIVVDTHRIPQLHRSKLRGNNARLHHHMEPRTHDVRENLRRVVCVLCEVRLG